MSSDAEKTLGSLEPMAIFTKWFEEAKAKAFENPMNEATAMTLSTVDSQGQASSRVVLLKQLTETGFVFFTSYISSKAQDIESNSKVALNFYWPQTFKQVKILGTVEKTSRQVSEQYWNSRPLGSQISQALSDQSKAIETRAQLIEKHQELSEQANGKPLPCPEDWGGYEVTPHDFEFWVGQDDRLHDRIVFTRQQGSWTAERLQP